MSRVPTIESALCKLIESGIRIDTVVDVGVQSGTSFLSDAFPRAHHHLFEPVDVYFDTIRTQYCDISHELHHVAVSSDTGTAFQVGVSADGSPRVTHSYISEEPIPIGQVTPQGIVLQCKSIEKVTLDTFFALRPILGSYLVKIDTDGHELPIIDGGAVVLGGADVVIVEAAMHSLLERANAIVRLGFDLLEMVDLCYYHDLLSQVDLIFVRKETALKCPDLRPWSTKAFSFEQWQRFSP